MMEMRVRMGVRKEDEGCSEAMMWVKGIGVGE